MIRGRPDGVNGGIREHAPSEKPDESGRIPGMTILLYAEQGRIGRMVNR